MEATSPAPDTFASTLHLPWWRIIALAVLGLGTLALCQATRSPNQSTEHGVVMELPIFVDSFMGEDLEPSISEVTMLPKDTVFKKRVYRDLRGVQIVAQIVLSGGERRSIHRPEICLPGQGWKITDGRTIPVKLTTGSTMNVMKLTLEREVVVGPNDKRRITNEFIYWFIGKDKTTADHMDRVILSSWDKVMHNTNHRWAYVICSSLVPEKIPGTNDPKTATIEMLKSFIGKVAPQIQKDGVTPG